jgi:undecaprenyl-diphosphatase
MAGLAAAGRRYPWAPIAGFVIFAMIAFAVLGGISQALDQRLFLAMADWARAHPPLIDFLSFLSLIAEPKFRMPGAIVLAIAMILARRSRIAVFIFAATAGGAALCSGLKALAARARPDLLPHFDHVTSHSFPSGHAWNGMIFYGETALVASLFLPRAWRIPVVAIGVLIAFVTGWSRIALGVHWPSDVLAGWIGGGAWLMLCYMLIVSPDARRGAANSTVDP